MGGGWPRIPLARRDGLAQDCVLGGRALLDACHRTCRRHGYVIAQGCIPEKCARALACSRARPRAPLSSLSSAEWRMRIASLSPWQCAHDGAMYTRVRWTEAVGVDTRAGGKWIKLVCI